MAPIDGNLHDEDSTCATGGALMNWENRNGKTKISGEVVIVMNSGQEKGTTWVEDSDHNGGTMILDGTSKKTFKIILSQVLKVQAPIPPCHFPITQFFKRWQTAAWFGKRERRSFNFTYDHLFEMRESAFEAQPQSESALTFIRELKPWLKGQMLVFFRPFNIDQIESFRHQILNYSGNRPLQEYYWLSGSPRCTGAQGWDVDDVSSIRYEGHDVFHHFDYWYITYACGMIWDERYRISQLNVIRHQRRDVHILRIPCSNNTIDQAALASNCHYVGFTGLTEEEVAMTCFHVGRTFTVQVHREDTHPSRQSATEQKPQWEATVIPQFPGLEAPGNLTFLMRRCKGTSAVASVDNEEAGPSMKCQSVYFQPGNSNMPARRMLAAVNNVYDGRSDRHDDLRRILQGQHPSHGQPFEGFFQSLSPSNQERFKQLKTQLSKHQLSALLKLCKQETFAFLMGVPGSGKSHFIMILTQMLEVVGKKTLITCANDTAVELLAARFEKAAPALKVIRYQGFRSDKLPTHKGKDIVAQGSERPSKDILYHEKSEATARLMEYASQLSRRKESMIERADAKHTSLMARCLQECGLDPTTQPEAPDEATKRFRQIHLQGKTGSSGTPNYEKTFNSALKALQASILAKSSVVLTTPINAGDAFLTERFSPDMAIADDVSGSTEPETLVMWTRFIGRIAFFLGVGDDKQSRPLVRSLGAKRQDGKLINHFAASYGKSLLTRRKHLKDGVVMLNATHRMTEGLQEPSSGLWYPNKILFSESCALTNRPLSQSFLRYVRAEYSLAGSVPRLVLHIPHAVSQRNALGSRYNVYNIALALREVKRMLELRIFKPSDICIAVPYRQQATLYSQAVEDALQLADWQGLGLNDIRVMTIGSLVADEAELIVL
ncbi:MAG: hypothetical protein Q9208_007680 [Pyrenodesmia sp. 3 TL-2023]